MDSKSYSNSIELGMVIPGGILMGLGLLGLARYVFIKRKMNQSLWKKLLLDEDKSW